MGRVVPAEEVEKGDFLTGLGNGYVFDIDHAPDVRVADGRHLFQAGGQGYTWFTFHDENGDENYLLVAPDLMVTIERREE